MEILVVITIVGLLSTIAIGGYTRYRKASLLQIAGDNLISTLYKARDEVKLGKISDTGGFGETGGGSVICRGLSFSGGEISVVKVPFVSKKYFNGDEWVARGCEANSAKKNSEPLGLDNDVDVLSVEPAGDYSILFVPPMGEVSVVVSADSDGGLKPMNDEFVTVTLGYGSDADYQRIIQINTKTATANVVQK